MNLRSVQSLQATIQDPMNDAMILLRKMLERSIMAEEVMQRSEL